MHYISSRFILVIFMLANFQRVFGTESVTNPEQEFSYEDWAEEHVRIGNLIAASRYVHELPRDVLMDIGRGVWLSGNEFLTCQHVGDFSWTPFNSGIKEEKKSDDKSFLPQETIQQNPSVEEEIRESGALLGDSRAVIIVKIYTEDHQQEPQQFVITAHERVHEVLKVSHRVSWSPVEITPDEGLTVLYTDREPSYAAKIPPTEIFGLSVPLRGEMRAQVIPVLTKTSLNFFARKGFVTVGWNLGEQYLYRMGCDLVSNQIFIPRVSVESGQSGSPVYVDGKLIGVVAGNMKRCSFILSAQNATSDLNKESHGRLAFKELEDGDFEFFLDGCLRVIPVPKNLSECIGVVQKQVAE